jgi:lipoprotein-releasing system ATP-binding protein
MNDNIDFEILSLKNISHIYDQENHKLKVLNNINIGIRKGEMVSLIGPSGSGKSTLLNIAGLLEKPSIGSVYLIGRNCKNINEEAKVNLRGSNIGFVFQSHRLFPEFSALENVMLPQLIMGTSKKQAESNSKELLSMLGLEKRFSHRPAKLSGGESQRVAIARAVANSPNLILADEPTGNLDPLSAQNVFDILYKVAKSLNISCLIATHNLVLARSMDRCLFLENGTIKEQ